MPPFIPAWYAFPLAPDPRGRVTTTYLDVRAILTMEARRLIARGQTDGTSLRAFEFAVGLGGFDPYNYLAAIPVNPDVYALTEETFSSDIDHIEWPNAEAVAFYCLLEAAEANATLGEIGIRAVVMNSPGDPADASVVLMAIGHFPLIAKNSSMQYVLRVTVQA